MFFGCPSLSVCMSSMGKYIEYIKSIASLINGVVVMLYNPKLIFEYTEIEW